MSFQGVLINLMLGCRLAIKCMLYFLRFLSLVTSEVKTVSLHERSPTTVETDILRQFLL